MPLLVHNRPIFRRAPETTRSAESPQMRGFCWLLPREARRTNNPLAERSEHASIASPRGLTRADVHSRASTLLAFCRLCGSIAGSHGEEPRTCRGKSDDTPGDCPGMAHACATSVGESGKHGKRNENPEKQTSVDARIAPQAGRQLRAEASAAFSACANDNRSRGPRKLPICTALPWLRSVSLRGMSSGWSRCTLTQ